MSRDFRRLERERGGTTERARARAREPPGVAEDMCAGPDALVSSNEAAAAAQQSAAPAVPSSPGPSAVPAVPDHDGGAGPRRNTALADAGDADARARARGPASILPASPNPPARARPRSRGGARAPRASPRGGRFSPPAARPSRRARRGSRTVGPRPTPPPPPRFKRRRIFPAARRRRGSTSARPRNRAWRRKKRPRPFLTAGDFFDDALCERFGRDARLGSVDRDHGSVDTPKNPKPSTLRRSRGGSGSQDGGTFDERESADESPSRRRRLDRDGAFARRGETRNISRPAKSNSETYSPAKSRDAPMHDALSDFGPLMDLLEGRPATATAPSGQRSENPSRRATRRARRRSPPAPRRSLADDPRDSVAAAGDGNEVFPRHSSKSTRVETNERFDENAGEETHGVGFLDGLLVDAVDDVFGPPGEKSSAELFLRATARTPASRRA